MCSFGSLFCQQHSDWHVINPQSVVEHCSMKGEARECYFCHNALTWLERKQLMSSQILTGDLLR